MASEPRTPAQEESIAKLRQDIRQMFQLQKAKPEIQKRVVAVPKVIKPGSADKPNPAQE